MPHHETGNKLGRFLGSAATVAVSGVVAWGVSVYHTNVELGIANEQVQLEKDKDKIAIVNLIVDKETTLAQALIDYYEAKFADKDQDYATLLKAISNHLDTASGLISNSDPLISSDIDLSGIVSSITADFIRDQFFSSNRRNYAEELVEIYQKSNSTSQSEIISELLSAIIAKGSDGTRRYRVNLYIALTFSLLPKANLDATQLKKIESLQAYDEYGDKTFKLNVDRAISKQK